MPLPDTPSSTANDRVNNRDSSESVWFTDFVPRRGIRNGDLQTLLANFLPRRVNLPAPEEAIVEVDPASGTRVMCHCHWQPETARGDHMTLLLLHGLEGSSQSQYMRGIAHKAWRAGWNVVRMNMRNCGSTEYLSATLYHSGLSGDVKAVANFFVKRHGLKQMAWIGYSMGGNMVLKAAGEFGKNAPSWLRAVVGVSPVIDMEPSADALHLPRNRVYEWNFLRHMIRRYRRKAAVAPERFSVEHCDKARSIRLYDEYIVAPNCGFAGADDYYERAAAARVVHNIAVPALIVHSLDDPFIRLLPDTRSRILANPYIAFVETGRGGHCGFLAAPSHEDDGYWAETTLIRFIQSVANIPREAKP